PAHHGKAGVCRARKRVGGIGGAHGCAMYEEKKVEPRVFRNYSQKELDDAYDQGVWAQNAQEVIKRYTTNSEAVRATYKPRTLKYGTTAEETLDWSSTARQNAPVQIFIHGGAWRLLSKDDSSAPAPTFVDSGAHYV